MFSIDYNELMDYNEKLFKTEKNVLENVTQRLILQHSSVIV